MKNNFRIKTLKDTKFRSCWHQYTWTDWCESWGKILINRNCATADITWWKSVRLEQEFLYQTDRLIFWNMYKQINFVKRCSMYFWYWNSFDCFTWTPFDSNNFLIKAIFPFQRFFHENDVLLLILFWHKWYFISKYNFSLRISISNDLPVLKSSISNHFW